MIHKLNIVQLLSPLNNVDSIIREIGNEIGNDEFVDSALAFRSKYISKYLRSDLVCFVEYPYIDKYYRNTYYNYHSTKAYHYEKDCIRISFFDSSIDQSAFDNKTLHIECKEKDHFLGYLVIRPTKLNPFGRSVFSPKISNHPMDFVMLRKFSCLINGSKLDINAFPNSGQDGEYHTCAETSIMSTLSYFSKYDNFNEKLPSEIIAIVDKLKSERVSPSEGLTKQEISFVLKKSGFGVKAYNKDKLDSELFNKILNDYIESGIPVIATISSKKSHHVSIIIGHENLEGLSPKINSVTNYGDKIILDSSEMYDKQYVFIDDNYPPYQLGTLNFPFKYYPEGDSKYAQITDFIVPLDKRIHIEAHRVRGLMGKILSRDSSFLAHTIAKSKTSPYITRYCLTTSNALKSTICCNQSMSLKVKNIIDSLNLPKFVWLVELSEADTYKNGEVNGFVIINSTGAAVMDSVLAIVWSDVIIIGEGKNARSSSIPDVTFPIYSNNLKSH